MKNYNYCIIIPALNPTESLVVYVDNLIVSGFSKIIIIDDGSDESCKKIFDVLTSKTECDLLRHYINLGKGRALKNSFNYYMNNYHDKYDGVITVDSDGQHSVHDVIRIMECMNDNHESVILGVRDFSKENVPFKSRFGNRMTRTVMKVFVGGNISDTQTGLRGIPNDYILRFLDCGGERFEYETNMLIEIIEQGINIEELQIETIYIDENRETHFNPISDSISIYKLIFSTFFKYIASSATSFVVDYCVFCLLIYFTYKWNEAYGIWIATIIARCCSSIYNYFVNKNVVFNSEEKQNTFVKYFVLVVVQMLCSAFFVSVINSMAVMSVQIVKLLVDSILFLVSFQIQKRLIFRRK